MEKKKKVSLPLLIFGAMVLGIVVGVVAAPNADAVAFISTYIKPFGTIFVNLLKAVVVPVVLLSIICGMISMDDVKKVGSVGWKTLVYYMGTTAVAIVIGLVVANLFKGAFPLLETADAAYEAKSANFSGISLAMLLGQTSPNVRTTMVITMVETVAPRSSS